MRKKRKDIIEIGFKYRDLQTCNLFDKEFGHWGCCCQCTSHKKVVSSFTNTPDHKHRGNFMGFYVCTIFSDCKGDPPSEEDYNAEICSEHGVCEMFTQREKNVPEDTQPIPKD